jgi:hypothetical protein
VREEYLGKTTCEGDRPEEANMARTRGKNRSLLQKLVWKLRERRGTQDHELYPEAFFSEKLTQEKRRAERSNRPLVVMVVDVQDLRSSADAGEITAILGEVVNACIRGTDICGRLKEDLRIGVILIGVEADRVGAAQASVAKKVKEKLASCFGREMVDWVAVTFQIFPVGSGQKGGAGTTFHPGLIETSYCIRRGQIAKAGREGEIDLSELAAKLKAAK